MESSVPDVDCPPVVMDALLSILAESILMIRLAGNADYADYCAEEADHIHNLPSILRHYDRDRLEHYLTWAQTGYASKFQKRFNRMPTEFMSEWKRLEDFLKDDSLNREKSLTAE